jgi:hypothetical protein
MTSDQFEGFEPSNTTPVPDVLFDVLLHELTGTEVKVLLYIIRRTRGFKKETDAISLTQFTKGIVTRDGKQLDRGCGVKDRKTVVETLASLEKKGCITSAKSKTEQGDDATTVYGIRFKNAGEKPIKKDRGSGKNQLGVVGKTNPGEWEKPTRGSGKNQLGVVGKTNPQETVIQLDSKQETVIQQSNAPEPASDPVVSGVAIAAASQTRITSDVLFPQEDKPQETKRPRNTLKAKLATLETFDFEQPATIDNIMLLGDCWRGSALPPLKRADSDYQKALSCATQLSQRKRQSGQSGYSLKEIDSAYRFFKRIAPDGRPNAIADDWWKGKNVDVWVIAKNIDKALDSLGIKTPNITTLPVANNNGEEYLNGRKVFKARKRTSDVKVS